MDDGTRHFLESLVSGLENNLRREFAGVENSFRRDMLETEARIVQRTDKLSSEAEVELLASIEVYGSATYARLCLPSP